VKDSKNITGIVLSGGQSSRMGRDKGLCLLHGKPLAGYVINVIRPFCDSLIISANNRDYDDFGYRVVPDLITGIGPAGGIYSSLAASMTEHNLVISCDMPLVSPGLISFILDQSDGFEAVIPVFNGHPEPLCAYYRQHVYKTFSASIEKGMLKIQDIIKGLNVRMIDIVPELDFYRPDLFINLNSLTELQALEEKIREKP
jgi:molybdopterin-guanine dinucleotide biosynthesis protein A